LPGTGAADLLQVSKTVEADAVVITAAKERVRINFPISNHVIPAQAGNQNTRKSWFPACAGMTKNAAITAFGNLFPTRS
jgi:hypothetical protein